MVNRREALKWTAGTALAATALNGRAAAASQPAEHCVFLWLGGGACQLDTFDPKRRGDPKKREPGSDYDAIPTAVEGIELCQHLSRTAQVMDRIALVRTLNHDVIDEHAAAVNRMHTGRLTSGTITYPSIGSIISHCRGPAADGMPPYVLMGAPNVTRGPGFIGPSAGYLYLTSAADGPAILKRPAALAKSRIERRETLLRSLRDEYLKQHAAGDASVAAYDALIDEAQRLAGPQFMQIFELEREPAALRESYGGEFGQRCLLARRLIERGVRFVEVSHNLNFVNGTGWDTHNEGQLKQHLLIEELDSALASLVIDLEEKGLLEKTLIVVATEFGRPAGFDSRGGRGHQGTCFSAVIGGGGLVGGQAIGTSDELSKLPIDRPVSVPDFFATMVAAMGIDPHRELYSPGDRPVPVTDGGTPIAELFS